jgi:hypothetical protein
LVERPAAVFAGVGGVEEKVDLSDTGGRLDALGAVDEIARARFHTEAIERVLAERRLSALAEVGRDLHGVALECALERGLELALRVGSVELGTRHADPCAAAGSTGANIGRDAAVGPEREPDKIVLGVLAAGEDAGAFGSVPRRRPGSRRRSL